MTYGRAEPPINPPEPRPGDEGTCHFCLKDKAWSQLHDVWRSEQAHGDICEDCGFECAVCENWEELKYAVMIPDAPEAPEKWHCITCALEKVLTLYADATALDVLARKIMYLDNGDLLDEILDELKTKLKKQRGVR